MRALPRLLTLVALLAACDRGDRPAAPPLVPVAPAAPARVAPASAAAPAARRPRRPAKSFAALKKELGKRCPLKEADSNVEQKQALADMTACVRRTMIRALDDVLVPLKKSAPARFSALMKEQAAWNRFVEAGCHLEEERFWVDLDSGQRDDGTMRGYPYLGCLDAAYTERLMYARALGGGDPAPLVGRVTAADKNGAAMQKIVAEVKASAERFQKRPPPPSDLGVSADFADIAKGCATVQAETAGMARSTCEGWPELAQALG
ncbi:MAG TPA: lysozyme inhibitor LprI family protein, partial [Polyangia bacterium]